MPVDKSPILLRKLLILVKGVIVGDILSPRIDERSVLPSSDRCLDTREVSCMVLRNVKVCDQLLSRAL